jgi:carbamoyl-phosphate synthase large subunit
VPECRETPGSTYQTSGELTAILRHYRLQSIFDEINHVLPDAQKVDYIREKDAIFIDDSYHERKLVQQKTGIPTFDCSMLEVLIDERA